MATLFGGFWVMILTGQIRHNEHFERWFQFAMAAILADTLARIDKNA